MSNVALFFNVLTLRRVNVIVKKLLNSGVKEELNKM